MAIKRIEGMLFLCSEDDLRLIVFAASVAYAHALMDGKSTQEAEWDRKRALDAALERATP